MKANQTEEGRKVDMDMAQRLLQIRERVEKATSNPYAIGKEQIEIALTLAFDMPWLLKYIDRLEAVASQSRILWDKSASHVHDCGGLNCPPYQNSWQELLGANVGINKSLTALGDFIASQGDASQTKENKDAK